MAAGNQLERIVDTYFLIAMSGIFAAFVNWLLARWDYLLAGACFLGAGAYISYLVFISHHIFWDINFYAAVMKTMAAGLSPYDDASVIKILGVPLSSAYNYPPFFAEVLYKLKWLVLTPAGRTFLIVAYIVSWVSIPYLLAGSPRKWYSRDFLYVWGLYLILFGLAGTRLLVVGNIASILFALVIFSIVMSVRLRDYKLFWVTILICGFIKPYFLVFLFFPVILDKRYLSAMALVLALLVLYLLNYLSNPELFAEYQRALAIQPSNLGNLGFSIYTLSLEIFSDVLGSGSRTNWVTGLALAVHFLFSFTILMAAYAVAARRARPRHFDVFCCWLFVSAFLISPRTFDYDLAVVVVPLVILMRMLLVESRLGVIVAVIVAGFCTTLLRSPTQFNVALSQWSSAFIMWAVWFGAAVYFLTSKRSVTGEGSNLQQLERATIVKG